MMPLDLHQVPSELDLIGSQSSFLGASYLGSITGCGPPGQLGRAAIPLVPLDKLLLPLPLCSLCFSFQNTFSPLCLSRSHTKSVEMNLNLPLKPPQKVLATGTCHSFEEQRQSQSDPQNTWCFLFNKYLLRSLSPCPPLCYAEGDIRGMEVI